MEITYSPAVWISRCVLTASLLLLAAPVPGDESAGTVRVTDEDTFGVSTEEDSRAAAGLSLSHPELVRDSLTPRPFAPSTNSEQVPLQSSPAIRANYGPPTREPQVPQAVPPNMMGDFFGGISNKPLILPGTVVDQAIFLQPAVDEFVDHLRGVTETGMGTFNTTSLVYLATMNGQPTNVVPTQNPAQLLQQFDGSTFLGDPATLGAVTDAGPFIAVNSGTTGDVTTLLPFPMGMLVDQPIYDIYDTMRIFVPSPGTGGGVGRQKIAENSSPIPRDRVFINHSTLSGVPLTPEGINVYRFTPGIEMTFFEQRFSIEVRLPFASTIDSDIGTMGVITDQESTQFGNIVGTLKALVRRTPTSALAVGLSVTAPTAKDMTINDITGAPFLSIENQSTHLMPFIGGLHTRGRAFSQWFVQGDIDATGSDVELRNVITDTYGNVGQMQDASFLFVSASCGYWLYQDGHRTTSFNSSPGREVKRTIYTGGGVTGIAPTAEFHYNRSLHASDTIQTGPLQIQSFTDFELANLVLGAVVTFGSGGTLTAGWGTPVLGQDDKQFAHQARVMFDYEY